MKKDQQKHMQNDQSSDEWNHEGLNDSDVDESDYILSNKKSDLKRQKIREQKRKRKNKKLNNSTWSLKENLLYAKFLKDHKQYFDLDKNQRRRMRINVLISKVVKTRSSNQCRSHHQKMMLYHKTLTDIIQFIQQQNVNEIIPHIVSCQPQQKEIHEVQAFDDSWKMVSFESEEVKECSYWAQEGVLWDGEQINFLF